MIARFDALPTHEGHATFIERSQDATGTFFALNRHDGHGLAFGHTAAERKPERVRPRCDDGMRRAGGRLEFEHGGHTGHAGKVPRETMPRPGDLEQQHSGFDPPHRAIVFEHGLVKRNGREAPADRRARRPGTTALGTVRRLDGCIPPHFINRLSLQGRELLPPRVHLLAMIRLGFLR